MTVEVSVIVPVYNSVGTLDRCVESLLGQSLTDIQIILVDDGSTDGSGGVCDAFGSRDRRVDVIHKANGGLSDARNAGLAVSRGEFVAFVDSDDWAQPEMLAEMVTAVRSASAEVAIAGCVVDVVDGQDRLLSSRDVLPGSGVVRENVPPREVTPDLINLLGYAWNKLYRRTLLDEYSCEFTVGLSLIEDMVFNARVFAKASSTVLVNNAYVHYIQRPGETLGGAFYPDFLGMRLQAIDLVGKVLGHWGTQPSNVRVELGTLRVSALRALAMLASRRTDCGLRSKSAFFRNARRQADGTIRAGELALVPRLEFHLLRRTPATFIMLAYLVRRRLGTGGVYR